MTRSLAVDGDNDIFVGADGALAMTTGRDAVLQCCEHAAKTQLGEMIYAADEGLPNFAAVWNGAPNLPLWESYLRRSLRAVPDVVSVVSVALDSAAGVLTYEATIQTIYGTGAISGGL